jgi:D-galactose 1-dehydrogenase
MAKYSIGIIGFGKIAHDQHAPAIAASPNFELVAVSNGGPAAPPPGVEGFAGYAEMLKAFPRLDAVAICTPPGPRRAIASDCLAAGRNVLLEKPPAGTVAEVTDIAAAARRAGKVAFAAYHAQHNAAVKRAAERLAGKRVKRLQVDWKEDIRRWHPGQDWILAAGGFGIFDPEINALSVLARIMPQPVFIKEAELFFPANRQAPIAANLQLGTGFNSDEMLRCAFDWRQTGPQTWMVEVETADGLTLKLSDGGARLEAPDEPAFVGPPDEYPDIYREFATLLDQSQSKVDAAPFQLVADAFMLGARTEVEPFSF